MAPRIAFIRLNLSWVEVMDREAAPGRVGCSASASLASRNRSDRDRFRREPGKIGGGELERWL
jgi:hypothetical protein